MEETAKTIHATQQEQKHAIAAEGSGPTSNLHQAGWPGQQFFSTWKPACTEPVVDRPSMS